MVSWSSINEVRSNFLIVWFQEVSNITIAKNKASSGVALFNYYNSVPSITNSIIWGEIINDTATPTYSYSLIKDNSDTSNQNLDASEITEFDLFKDPDNDDYSVLNSSAIVDAGSNTAYINMGGDLTSDTDISGKSGIQISVDPPTYAHCSVLEGNKRLLFQGKGVK